MKEISTHKEPNGWRAVVRDGHKTLVVEGIFDSEAEAKKAALLADNLPKSA